MAAAVKSTKFTAWSARKHRRWVHPGLFAAESKVPGAGTGVFAAWDLPKHTHLGYYCGRVHWTYPQRNKRNWVYMLALARRPPWIAREVWRAKKRRGQTPCVDGVGILSQCNCHHGGYVQNADFNATGRFYTLRHVKAGQEILVNYGEEYWESRET
jgi:hypothetical protein